MERKIDSIRPIAAQLKVEADSFAPEPREVYLTVTVHGEALTLPVDGTLSITETI
jgi:hypothetical protein